MAVVYQWGDVSRVIPTGAHTSQLDLSGHCEIPVPISAPRLQALGPVVAQRIVLYMFVCNLVVSVLSTFYDL